MLTSSFNRRDFYSELKDVEVRLAESIKERLNRAGPYSSNPSCHGNWYSGALRGFSMRADRVRRSIEESEGIALRNIQGKLGNIRIESVWPILKSICHDMALYLGGGAVAGGAVGGGLGFLVFGGGIVYGAAAGSVIGVKMAAMLLGFLGLKSVIQYMLENIPRAIDEYQRGFKDAWGRMPDLSGWSSPHCGAEIHIYNFTSSAAASFARGHEIIVLAMLMGIVTYLTRSRGSLSTLLTEARQSTRLGPSFASWLEQNAEKLTKHPFLKTSNRSNGAAPFSSIAPIAPSSSQIRQRNNRAVPESAVISTRPKDRTAKEPSSTAIQTYWPPNGGFATKPTPETLQPGYLFSRYGGYVDETGTFNDFGSFVAPANVPYGMRALPPGTDLRPLSTYEVVRPIHNVPSGPAASYFGELGQGKQHQLPMTIQDYLDQGIIRLVERKVPTKP